MADENSTPQSGEAAQPQSAEQQQAAAQPQPESQPQQPAQPQPTPQPQAAQPWQGAAPDPAAQQGYRPPVPPQGAPGANPGFQQPYGAAGPNAGFPPPQGAPMYYAQPQPLVQLSGGMKFGWFAVGFLIGIAGPLLAWLLNADKAQQVKSDALKWSIIGAAVGICLNLISFTFLFGSVAALGTLGTATSSFTW